MDSKTTGPVQSGNDVHRKKFLRSKIDRIIRETDESLSAPNSGIKSEDLKDTFINSVWPKLIADYQIMVEDLRAFCKNGLDARAINCQITGRTKAVDSVEKALSRREKQLWEQDQKRYESVNDIFYELHDLVGLRIVLDFPCDIEKAEQFIRENFKPEKNTSVFCSDREVGGFWKTWFGAYQTRNHRVSVKNEKEGSLSRSCDVMFEIQLTTLAEDLYNKLAHPLLYKGLSGNLTREDEIVIDMSHGISLCYAMCVMYMKDKLERIPGRTTYEDFMRPSLLAGNVDDMKQEVVADGKTFLEHLTRSAGFDNRNRQDLTKALEPPEGCSSLDDLKAWLNRKLENTIREFRQADSMPQPSEAAVALRKSYIESKCLEIQRISGDQLSMRDCYINLAIVEQSSSEEVHAHPDSSHFTLFDRRKIGTVNDGTSVSLNRLFDPRKNSGDRLVTPKRILIHGRAGVGKTTLCKKIVYDYLYQGMWKNLFDWVFWVPLRNLKMRSSRTSYNMGDLFYDEYFSQQLNGESLALVMWELINESSAHDKTLFILDGLDEVSQEWSSESPMTKFLDFLLRQSQIIITSRPQALSQNVLKSIDLELETIGFQPEQVAAYINNTEMESAERIQAFIRDHWLIQELVRIPIQLDALCYSWTNDFLVEDGPQNMTTLYQAIEIKLWKKDILRLGKLEGSSMSESVLQNLPPSEIKTIMESEIHFLQSLAFTGMYSDIVDFNAWHRDKIYECFKPRRSRFLSSNLIKLSFLRTSGPIPKNSDSTYHFHHLTNQEFFAAQYFVRCWEEGELLFCLKLSSAKRKSITTVTPEKFLQREKYNGHYDIFWRFVAGLLLDRDEEQLRRFFEIMEDEPRDLLGPVHQRIILHCFSEVPASHLEDLRKKVEEQAKNWAFFEYKIHGELKQCREMEFPEGLLHALIKEESEGVKIAALEALCHRSQLSSRLLNQVAAFIHRDVSTDLRRPALDALKNQKDLPENILQAVVSQLDDTDLFIRTSAVSASKNTTLCPNILQSTVSILRDILQSTASILRDILQSQVSIQRDSHPIVKWYAVEVLMNQSILPEDIIQIIVSQLGHPDQGVRSCAIKILSNRKNLSEDTIQAIVSHVWNPVSYIVHSAMEVLGKQATLSEDVLQAVVAQLEHADGKVRRSAIATLGRQMALPETMFNALVSHLEDPALDVRHATVDSLSALSKRITLSEDVLNKILSRMVHTDWQVRKSVIDIFDNQEQIPEEILQFMVSHLEDPQPLVRQSVIRVLGSRTYLSEGFLRTLLSRLKDPEPLVRQSIIRALGNQAHLAEDILRSIISQFGDTDSHVRASIIDTLVKQTTLPLDILQFIVLRLEDTEPYIRHQAIEALDIQFTLQVDTLRSYILQAIMSRLEDPERNVRLSVVRAFSHRSMLSEDILQALVSRLDDPVWEIRDLASSILDSQTHLSEDILRAMISLIENASGEVRSLSRIVLNKKFAMPDSIIKSLVSVFSRDNDGVMIFSSWDILLKQDNLFDDLSILDTTMLRTLYKKLVRGSFSQQLSCYGQDGTFYFNMLDRRIEIPLTPNNDHLVDAFQAEALALGTPIPSAASSSQMDVNSRSSFTS